MPCQADNRHIRRNLIFESTGLPLPMFSSVCVVSILLVRGKWVVSLIISLGEVSPGPHHFMVRVRDEAYEYLFKGGILEER